MLRWIFAAKGLLYPSSQSIGHDAVQHQSNHMTALERITQQPIIMGGKPCIRGLRATVQQLLTEYPYLESEGIAQTLQYAAWRAASD